MATVFLLLFLALPQTSRGGPPVLVPRGYAGEAATTSLDARVVSPSEIPAEASGLYEFERARDTLEVDFTPDGLSGYITVLGDSETDKGQPLTFFFERTTVGGDRFTFLTHEVHRTRYEFDGRVRQSQVVPKRFAAQFWLDGMLTIHHLQPNGSDQTERRHVVFRSAQRGD